MPMTAEERMARFKNAKKLHDEEVKSHEYSEYEKVEVPDFKYCVLTKNEPKVIRLLGASLEMAKKPTDPVIVNKALCCDDEGKYVNIIYSSDPNHPMNKLMKTILGKYTWDKEKKCRIYDNANIPVFKRFTTNNKEKVSPFEKGMIPTKWILMNCLDKDDNWCVENKHSKVLCWDVNTKEVDGEIREYPSYGVKSSFYTEIWDKQCTILNKHFDETDFVVKRLDEKTKVGDSYLIVCSPEEKSKIVNLGVDYSKVNGDYLTEEEENYELYELRDIPFISKPTPCSVILKRFDKLIKDADSTFGTNLRSEFVEWKEKELAELKANSETEKNETNSSTNNESSNEPSVSKANFSDMKTVETVENEDELPTEVEEKVELPTVKKVMKNVKPKFDPMSLKDIFPNIVNMSKEDLDYIVDVDENNGELIYVDGTEIATCPNCNMDIPDPWTKCVCGVSFE